MPEAAIHLWLTLGELLLAPITFGVLLFIKAPYGRHYRGGWGPALPRRIAWAVMESPACVLFLVFYLRGPSRGDLVPLVLLGAWQSHYVYRAFVFPWRMRGRDRRVPALIPGLALLFNSGNAYINASWISGAGAYGVEWLGDPRFGIGAAIFGLGLAINLHSDEILLRLRKPGESGYRIPTGGLYRWISCPNYLGEILEWTGWAIATWSLPGLAFALYTAANLAPRALDHHRWYRAEFDDYPSRRRALVPFVL